MPRAVQRATAADVPYSMSSGCATTQSTRWKDSSGRAGNVMSAILPELFPAGDGPAGPRSARASTSRPPPGDGDDPATPGRVWAEQRQRGTVESIEAPGADQGDCGDRFVYQGLHHAT